MKQPCAIRYLITLTNMRQTGSASTTKYYIIITSSTTATCASLSGTALQSRSRHKLLRNNNQPEKKENCGHDISLRAFLLALNLIVCVSPFLPSPC